MRKLLKKIHHAIPLNVRQIYMPLLNRLIYFFQNHINAVYPPVVLYEGLELKSQKPFAFAYAGNVHQMHNYWDHVVLSDGFKKRFLGRRFFAKIRTDIKNNYPDCGILIMEQSPLTVPFLNKKPGFSIPFWIRMEIDIRPPLKHLFAEQRSDIERLIRKHHLSYELSKDPAHFEGFYHNMYVPYVKMRYTDAAGVNTYETFKKAVPNSEMILIKKEGQVIAAGMVEFIKGRPFLRRLGIVEANQTYVRYGAISAIYFFLVQELKKRGYTVMDVGGTRPLLSDGLTRYKISFAARLCKENNRHSCVRLLVLNDSSAARSFLRHNSFLFKNNKMICRAMFVEPDENLTAKALNHSLQSSYCDGIHHTRIYRLGDKDLPDGISAPGQKISVHPLNLLIPL